MSSQLTSENSRPDSMGDGSVLRVHPMPLEDGTLGEAMLVQVRGSRRVVYLTVTAKFANTLFTALSLPACILLDLLNEATYLSPIGAVSDLFESLRDEDGASGHELTDDGREQEDEPKPEPDPDEDAPSAPPRLAGNNGAAAAVGDKKMRTVGRKRKAPNGTEKSDKLKRTLAEERLWHLHIYKQLVMHQDVQLTKMSKKEYRCPNASPEQDCSIWVSDVRGSNCVKCRAEMTVELVPDTGLTFVQDAPTVTFTENLRATPLRNERTFLELVVKGNDIHDMSMVKTRAITVGIKQVLQLAHAALTSSTPVTDVFGTVEENFGPY